MFLSPSLFPQPLLVSCSFSRLPGPPPPRGLISLLLCPVPYPQSCCPLAPGNASTLGWPGHCHYHRREMGSTPESRKSGHPDTPETIQSPVPYPYPHFSTFQGREGVRLLRTFWGKPRGEESKGMQTKKNTLSPCLASGSLVPCCKGPLPPPPWGHPSTALPPFAPASRSALLLTHF